MATGYNRFGERGTRCASYPQPHHPRSVCARPKRFIGDNHPIATVKRLLQEDPDRHSPEPEQLRGPETMALIAVQEYAADNRNYFLPQPAIGLAYYLELVRGIDTLLCDHIIAPSLAKNLLMQISAQYVRDGKL